MTAIRPWVHISGNGWVCQGRPLNGRAFTLDSPAGSAIQEACLRRIPPAENG